MITCSECTVLQEKGFFVCTSAERVAVSNHVRSCKVCYEEMVRLGLQAREEIKRTPGIVEEIAEIARETYIHDRLDPENR